MEKSFLLQTSLIHYNKVVARKSIFSSLSEIDLSKFPSEILWLNTYGLQFSEEIKTVSKQNEIDDFFIRLLLDEHRRNKMIGFNQSIFLSLQIVNFEGNSFKSEQMLFVLNTHFIWSLQEKTGNYFELIRERILQNKGFVREKGTNYLLFLLIETLIHNYEKAYKRFYDKLKRVWQKTENQKFLQNFVEEIERTKKELFVLKKSVMSLNETLRKLEEIQFLVDEAHYFTELREQAHSLIDDIEFELQDLESKTNLIFSMRSDRLNQVMQMLTIFSVVFIPLTFISGVYGMNFQNMPELNTQNGYFITWGVMLLIVIVSLLYFKKKKWF